MHPHALQLKIPPTVLYQRVGVLGIYRKTVPRRIEHYERAGSRAMQQRALRRTGSRVADPLAHGAHSATHKPFKRLKQHNKFVGINMCVLPPPDIVLFVQNTRTRALGIWVKKSVKKLHLGANPRQKSTGDFSKFSSVPSSGYLYPVRYPERRKPGTVALF